MLLQSEKIAGVMRKLAEEVYTGELVITFHSKTARFNFLKGDLIWGIAPEQKEEFSAVIATEHAIDPFKFAAGVTVVSEVEGLAELAISPGQLDLEQDDVVRAMRRQIVSALIQVFKWSDSHLERRSYTSKAVFFQGAVFRAGSLLDEVLLSNIAREGITSQNFLLRTARSMVGMEAMAAIDIDSGLPVAVYPAANYSEMEFTSPYYSKIAEEVVRLWKGIAEARDSEEELHTVFLLSSDHQFVIRVFGQENVLIAIIFNKEAEAFDGLKMLEEHASYVLELQAEGI